MTTRFGSLVYVCARFRDRPVRPACFICGAFDNEVLALVCIFR